MNWKPEGDDIHINVPPLRWGSTNPGTIGWWLMGSTDRSAIPMAGHIVCLHPATIPKGFTYDPTEVLIFIIQGILPKQPDPEDHG